MNLIDGIIDSLTSQPDRWKTLDKWMTFQRDDNVVLCVSDERQLTVPGRAHITLSWWQKRKARKAIHKWQTRPMAAL